jgi:Cu(I)/Ag(I) efflux system periplasmic protein CusF
MKRTLLSILAASLMSAPLYADEKHHQAATAAPQPAAAPSEGEVRKVDKATQKITIKHGPLANLDMPAMTMVFQVKDPAMLDRVKPGDKVNFEVEKIRGALIVTRLEPR